MCENLELQTVVFYPFFLYSLETPSSLNLGNRSLGRTLYYRNDQHSVYLTPLFINSFE
jgi:hypothetical protein